MGFVMENTTLNLIPQKRRATDIVKAVKDCERAHIANRRLFVCSDLMPLLQWVELGCIEADTLVWLRTRFTRCLECGHGCAGHWTKTLATYEELNNITPYEICEHIAHVHGLDNIIEVSVFLCDVCLASYKR